MSEISKRDERLAGVFDQRVARVAPDAPVQHRVLAFLGRDPSWTSE